jgi:hypothetical protein
MCAFAITEGELSMGLAAERWELVCSGR